MAWCAARLHAHPACCVPWCWHATTPTSHDGYISMYVPLTFLPLILCGGWECSRAALLLVMTIILVLHSLASRSPGPSLIIALITRHVHQDSMLSGCTLSRQISDWWITQVVHNLIPSHASLYISWYLVCCTIHQKHFVLSCGVLVLPLSSDCCKHIFSCSYHQLLWFHRVCEALIVCSGYIYPCPCTIDSICHYLLLLTHALIMLGVWRMIWTVCIHYSINHPNHHNCRTRVTSIDWLMLDLVDLVKKTMDLMHTSAQYHPDIAIFWTQQHYIYHQ